MAFFFEGIKMLCSSLCVAVCITYTGVYICVLCELLIYVCILIFVKSACDSPVTSAPAV